MLAQPTTRTSNQPPNVKPTHGVVQRGLGVTLPGPSGPHLGVFGAAELQQPEDANSQELGVLRLQTHENGRASAQVVHMHSRCGTGRRAGRSHAGLRAWAARMCGLQQSVLVWCQGAQQLSDQTWNQQETSMSWSTQDQKLQSTRVPPHSTHLLLRKAAGDLREHLLLLAAIL